MNHMQIFKFDSSEVRTILVNNEPYFVGKDVAEVLGYERPTKAAQDHVDKEDKDVVPIQDSIGRKQNTPIINESGLYSLILKSKLPSAKQFKRWVTSEVLPSIRKTGNYQVPSSPMDALRLMFEAQEQTAQQVNLIESRVDEIETNAPLEPGEYNYINRRVNRRVSEVGKRLGKLDNKQRAKLYKDINNGIHQVTGISTRTQLRKHHFEDVLEFISDWEPSTATKTIIKQMELEEVI